MNRHARRDYHSPAFTIVELLIVIVIIAILAAITIVAYNGIQARAKLAQQTAALDKIGRAIQLYSAEVGHSLDSSGAGYAGHGYGGFGSEGGGYTAVSVEELLRNSGYLTGSTEPLEGILVAPCLSEQNSRWIVFATVTPAPMESVADQRSKTGCTNSFLYGYSSGSYTSNLLKAY